MASRILAGTTPMTAADPVVEVAAELVTTTSAELVVVELEPLLGASKGVHTAASSTVLDDAVTAECAAAEQEAPDLVVVPRGGGHGDALLPRRASTALLSPARSSRPLQAVRTGVRRAVPTQMNTKGY